MKIYLFCSHTNCTHKEEGEEAKERVRGLLESPLTLSRSNNKKRLRKFGRERKIFRHYVPLLQDKKIGSKSLKKNFNFVNPQNKGGSDYQ